MKPKTRDRGKSARRQGCFTIMHVAGRNAPSDTEKCKRIDARALFHFAGSNLRDVSALPFCTLFRATSRRRACNVPLLLLFRRASTVLPGAFRTKTRMTHSTSVLERNLLEADEQKERGKRDRRNAALTVSCCGGDGGDGGIPSRGLACLPTSVVPRQARMRFTADPL